MTPSAEEGEITSSKKAGHSLITAFRGRLEAIGVESIIVESDLEDILVDRIEPPAVASAVNDTDLLPECVTTEPTRAELREAETGITPARLGVASQGSIVVESNEEMDGPVSLYPPKHIAILPAGEIVPDIGAALEELTRAFADGEKDFVFITGPSSTGDMGELIIGVHGPAEMEVVIVE